MLILLASCLHRSTIPHEELRSIVRSSIYFADEAEASIDRVAQGRTTRNFAAGHLDSIADELNDRGSKLKQSNRGPSLGDEHALKNTQQNIETLAAELTAVASQTNDSVATTAAAKQYIVAIRKALEETSRSL
jgi:hypothetical protein